MDDLAQATALLINDNYTCVFKKGDTVITKTERGVKPLLALLESGNSFCGFSAADRVVGKGAAFLYVLLGISALHAQVISESARDVLLTAGIFLSAETVVPRILNREKTGFCPIEECVFSLSSPTEALFAIKERVKQLSAK